MYAWYLCERLSYRINVYRTIIALAVIRGLYKSPLKSQGLAYNYNVFVALIKIGQNAI